jgi:hypothetical protein
MEPQRDQKKRRRTERWARGALLLPLLLGMAGSLLARAAAADPVDLGNPQPRWISMRFAAAPEPVFAWLEPGPRPGLVTVSVPASTVEAKLLGGEHPVAGSFTDFVWILDAASGDVLRADLAGRVIHELEWGFASFEADVELHIHLDTLHPAGFTPPRRLFGRPMRAYCTAQDDCTPVAPVRYRAREGEVRAVGSACARWRGLRTRAFSTLGEARLSETSGGLRAAAPPSPPPSSLAPWPASLEAGPDAGASANDSCG